MGQLASAVCNQSTQGFQQSQWTRYHDNTGMDHSNRHTRDVVVSDLADDERHWMLCCARFQHRRQSSDGEGGRVGDDESSELSQE